MKNKALYNPVSFKKPDENIEAKKAEIMLAAAVGCHCAIKNVDCFGEIIKTMCGEGAAASHLSIKRTKCTAIIKNVISAQFKSDIKTNMHDRPYAVLLDESTDVGCTKILAICARYYSVKESAILTEFLGIVEVIETTGEALYNALVSVLEQYELKVDNIIYFSSDGANNVSGRNNSVWSRKERYLKPYFFNNEK